MTQWVQHPVFSSRSEEWGTPRGVFDRLHREFAFTLDPCATAENAKCPCYFTKAQDGLTQSWAGERVFMNPPYGKTIGRWMEKLATSQCKVGVALIHARTDTRWWHTWVEPYADEIRFLKGRVKFDGGRYSSTFPSVVVVYRADSTRHAWGTHQEAGRR